MITLSLSFWAFAAGAIFVAVELFQFMGPLTGEIVDKVVLLAPGAIMVVLAVFLFVIGMIGLCGACQEGNCLKGTFCIILFVIIVIEVGGVVCGIVFKDEVKQGLETSLKTALQKYEDDTPTAEAFDTLQHTLECCGVNAYTDWATTPWELTHLTFVPQSCCKKTVKSCTGSLLDQTMGHIYTKGCSPKLNDDIQHYLVIIIAVAVAFGLIQIIGLGCTCSLLCSKKREVPYQSLNAERESGGYRA